jgi:hypothetical protein
MRHKNAPTARSADPNTPVETAAPEMPGGAAGIPAAADLQPYNPGAGRYVKAKEYMVTDGPRMADNKIKYNAPLGYMVGLTPGKIVSSATHNLDHMRRQGIRLEAMPEEVEVTDESEVGEPGAEQASA